MKKSICIISFSPIYRDARVLRQIKYFSSSYDLTVIGYGDPHPAWKEVENIKWLVVPHSKPSWLRKISGGIFLALGRLRPSFYERIYWRKRDHIHAYQLAVSNPCDAYHANDWEALPAAAEAARQNKGKLVFDAHEYAPLEFENRRFWLFLFSPFIRTILQKYVSQVDASTTVAPMIADRYRKEFGFDPAVVLNSPEPIPMGSKELDPDHIKLIHHGGAFPYRRLEKMIETLALCDRRFSLHFMLVNNDPNYLRKLQNIADELTPGRVTFHEPVMPEQIIQRISEYDVGFCLIAPTNYNYLVSLPNKFFDYIVSGLPVCIGPSPSMAEIVNQYGIGCVAPSFHIQDVAKTLNQLSSEKIVAMQRRSREAAIKLNADVEMGKLLNLYKNLFERRD